MLVDSTGVGEPVYEALRAGGCRAEAYPFTSRSKSDLINALAILFEKREITLPRPELCPELIDECESYEYSITDSGNVRMSSPSGCHDDTVVALALASWRARKESGSTRSRASPASKRIR